MSDDIVQRLRAIGDWPFDVEPRDCSIEAAEAADEIEHLRAQVAAADEDLSQVVAGSVELLARIERLTAAILDIDSHAAALGEDHDGFVAMGYLISVGCLHRALGVVGHSARKCARCGPESHDCVADTPRPSFDAQAARDAAADSAYPTNRGGRDRT